MDPFNVAISYFWLFLKRKLLSGWVIAKQTCTTTLYIVHNWSRFHQHFKSNFYASRSQMGKKDSQVISVIFSLLGPTSVKAERNMLMKLTHGSWKMKVFWESKLFDLRNNNIHSERVRERECVCMCVGESLSMCMCMYLCVCVRVCECMCMGERERESARGKLIDPLSKVNSLDRTDIRK